MLKSSVKLIVHTSLLLLTLSVTPTAHADLQIGDGSLTMAYRGVPYHYLPVILEVWEDKDSPPTLEDVTFPNNGKWTAKKYVANCFKEIGVKVIWRGVTEGAATHTYEGGGFTVSAKVLSDSQQSSASGKDGRKTIILSNQNIGNVTGKAVDGTYAYSFPYGTNTNCKPNRPMLIAFLRNSIDRDTTPPVQKNWKLANALVHELTHVAMSSGDTGYHCDQSALRCVITKNVNGLDRDLRSIFKPLRKNPRKGKPPMIVYSAWHSLVEVNKIRRNMEISEWEEP